VNRRSCRGISNNSISSIASLNQEASKELKLLFDLSCSSLIKLKSPMTTHGPAVARPTSLSSSKNAGLSPWAKGHSNCDGEDGVRSCKLEGGCDGGGNQGEEGGVLT
jgi:hypothetical protein